jgi:hypothetical protein
LLATGLGLEGNSRFQSYASKDRVKIDGADCEGKLNVWNGREWWANLVASNPRLLLEVGKQSDSFLPMRRRGGIIMARSAKGTAAPGYENPIGQVVVRNAGKEISAAPHELPGVGASD